MPLVSKMRALLLVFSSGLLSALAANHEIYNGYVFFKLLFLALQCFLHITGWAERSWVPCFKPLHPSYPIPPFPLRHFHSPLNVEF